MVKIAPAATIDFPLIYVISCAITHRSIAAYAQTISKRTTTSEDICLYLQGT